MLLANGDQALPFQVCTFAPPTLPAITSWPRNMPRSLTEPLVKPPPNSLQLAPLKIASLRAVTAPTLVNQPPASSWFWNTDSFDTLASKLPPTARSVVPSQDTTSALAGETLNSPPM